VKKKPTCAIVYKYTTCLKELEELDILTCLNMQYTSLESNVRNATVDQNKVVGIRGGGDILLKTCFCTLS
jgi:hypothetical protein